MEAIVFAFTIVMANAAPGVVARAPCAGSGSPDDRPSTVRPVSADRRRAKFSGFGYPYRGGSGPMPSAPANPRGPGRWTILVAIGALSLAVSAQTPQLSLVSTAWPPF